MRLCDFRKLVRCAPQRAGDVAWFSVPQPRQVATTGKPTKYSWPRAKRRCIRPSRQTPSSLSQRVQRHSDAREPCAPPRDRVLRAARPARSDLRWIRPWLRLDRSNHGAVCGFGGCSSDSAAEAQLGIGVRQAAISVRLAKLANSRMCVFFRLTPRALSIR